MCRESTIAFASCVYPCLQGKKYNEPIAQTVPGREPIRLSNLLRVAAVSALSAMCSRSALSEWGWGGVDHLATERKRGLCLPTHGASSQLPWPRDVNLATQRTCSHPMSDVTYCVRVQKVFRNSSFSVLKCLQHHHRRV